MSGFFNCVQVSRAEVSCHTTKRRDYSHWLVPRLSISERSLERPVTCYIFVDVMASVDRSFPTLYAIQERMLCLCSSECVDCLRVDAELKCEVEVIVFHVPL